jgi:hypothetical protein
VKTLWTIAAALALWMALPASAWAQRFDPCAGVDDAVERINATRRDAPPAREHEADLRARDELAALNRACPSPWVALHLGLTERALGDVAASLRALEAALDARDPRVDAMRADLEGIVQTLRRVHDDNPAPRPPASPTRRPLRPFGYTLIGVGVAAGVTGAVFGALTFGTAGAIGRACDAPSPTAAQRSLCASAPRSNQTSVVPWQRACDATTAGSDGAALCERHRTWTTLGIAFGVGGAVALATGVTLALLAPDAAPPRVAVSLAIDAGTPMLSAFGRF